MGNGGGMPSRGDWLYIIGSYLFAITAIILLVVYILRFCILRFC